VGPHHDVQLLGGAAALDWRAAGRTDAPEPRRLCWVAYLLAALLMAVLVGFQALRFTG